MVSSPCKIFDTNIWQLSCTVYLCVICCSFCYDDNEKKSLCWYDDRISFVLSWWQGKAVFVVTMTGKTGSNIPVGPEPASALIRRSTTLLTCRARYSDIQNTTFSIFWYFLGDQLLRYSIIQYHMFTIRACNHYIHYYILLHTRVFLQSLFIFTNIIFADASLPHTHEKNCER